MVIALSSIESLLTILRKFQRSVKSERSNMVIEKIIRSENVDKLLNNLEESIFKKELYNHGRNDTISNFGVEEG